MPDNKRPSARLPLAGVRVLDLGQIYQGPYAGFLLAQAGADVIKVEPPKGEPARLRAPPGKNTSLPMAMLNSNKRCITLNLKAERGRDLLRQLAKKSDVLIENFAPGVMEKMGIGFSSLHELAPRLIYASGTGFGLSGPDRDNLAMDLTVQAASGIMSITGFADSPPLRAGPPIVDFLSGTHLFGAIMVALCERQHSGVGRLVELAMQEAVYPMLASNLGLYYNSGGTLVPPRTGNLHGGLDIVPHEVYPVKDGHVALQCTTERHWHNLLDAMQRDDLKDDPRFSEKLERIKNIAVVDAMVSDWTRRHTRQEIVELAKRYRIPCAPVRDLVEVVHDPHMHGRGALVWIEHPELGRVVVPRTPLRVHGAAEPDLVPSARLGEHNEGIYGSLLGLETQQIAELRDEGVI